MADNAENLRQADLAKLPFFTGAKSDVFSCEMWVQRVQRCKDSSNWNDATTMTYVFNALRGEALEWTRTLNRSSVNVDEWNSFKKGLLYAFSAVRTSRTTTVNLANLLQNQAERVVSYYTRVVNTVNDLEGLSPNVAIPAEPWTAAFQAVPQLMGLPVADRAAQVQKLVDHGAQRIYDLLALNIFVSNLRPSLRDEVNRQSPKTLNDAFEMAMEAEKAQYDPRKSFTQPMMPISPTDENTTTDADTEDSLQAELDELTNSHAGRVDAIKRKMSKFRRPGGATSQQKGRPTAPPGAIPKNPAHKSMKCRFCGLLGHVQFDCYKRRKANAPMVGADGKPYTPKPVGNVNPQPQDQVLSQGQAQFIPTHPSNYAPQMYTQQYNPSDFQ